MAVSGAPPPPMPPGGGPPPPPPPAMAVVAAAPPQEDERGSLLRAIEMGTVFIGTFLCALYIKYTAF